MVNLGNSWDEILKYEFEKPYYKDLRAFLKTEYQTKTIYPKMEDIFNSLKLTAFEDVKVVILGQDPYHGENQAFGLSFAVKKGVKIPPSLCNIYKEISAEFGCEIPTHGDLTHLAKQGVLLLNTVLTVREGSPNSHKGKGWESFTDSIILYLNNRKERVIFLLWGNNAKNKVGLITNPQHQILTSVHPSPLSAHGGFFGCGHFKMANELLKNMNKSPVDWVIK